MTVTKIYVGEFRSHKILNANLCSVWVETKNLADLKYIEHSNEDTTIYLFVTSVITGVRLS